MFSLIETIAISEVEDMINKNLDPKNPGLDLTAVKVFRKLPTEAQILLTQIYNAILRVGDFSSQRKVGQAIMILETGGSRPNSILSILSKLYLNYYQSDT